MNGTSGFQEVRSSPSRSPSYRLLDEQQPQFGKSSWPLYLAIQILSFLLLWLPCLSSSSQAQTPPITPSGLHTKVDLSTTPPAGKVQYDITGGTRPGGGANLFHSFGELGVPANNIANFLNGVSFDLNGNPLAAGLQTSNILGRVTGGNISNIFGTIQTTGFGNANLFLMNPAGFLFGPNATVNVGGMVAFTSADYLRLGELGSSDAGIFRADPAQASILTNAPVAAFGFLGSNPGAITIQGSQFFAKSISLVGGNISIESGTPEGGTAHPAKLFAPNGNILLASARSPGEFDATTLDSLPNVNDTSFSSFGSISLAPGSSVDVSGTSTVSIRGGQFVLSVNDAALTTSRPPGPPETITLSPGSSVVSSNFGIGPGADVQLIASNIQMNGTNITAQSSLSDSSAGNITLKATQQITAVDSFLNTDAEEGIRGGGDILLRAPTIALNGGVLSATTSGSGHAGNILLEGQQIRLGASPFAAAQGVDFFTGTSGSGAGGSVTLRGLDGPTSHADNVTISGFSRLHADTFSDGKAGAITINAAQFTLTGHATLSADSSFGDGDAGTITITATDSVIVSGPSTKLSSSSVFGATGNAGLITVSAPRVMIENGGSISTSTTGERTGGNINILAGQSVTMTNGASISASSTGAGNAGNIMINAGNQLAMTNSSMTTQADQASGGNIAVLATDMVQLTNSQLNASVQGSSTTVGGNITIDPLHVILQNSQILAIATQGQGGAISITITNGGLFLADANSTVSASSQFGVNGTVTIQSPNAPASGKIQPLGKSPLQATSLLNQRCASLAGGEFSSFTLAGRDSLPTEPGSWLASPLALGPAGFSAGTVTEGGEQALVIDLAQETTVLSLRQIAPAGFLTQAYAVDWSASCHS